MLNNHIKGYEMSHFNRTVNWALFIVVIYGMIGCATIFKGSTDKVNFSSNPATTKVYVNGQYMGATPFELMLPSKNTYTIEFRKEGYESKTMILTNSVGAGWIILDVLFGFGTIGVPILVDAVTGNWYNLDQEHVAAVLEAQQ
jgi:hypothetical protein